MLEHYLSALLRTPERGIALLLLVVLVAYGSGIDKVGYNKDDELIYLRSGLGMVESGNYLYPVYEGNVRLQKPPAAYWMVALSYHLFGPSLFAGRLPTVLLAVLGVYLTSRLGAVLFRPKQAGLYSACALACSYAYYLSGRVAMTDMLLTCSILGAYCGFAATLFSGSRTGSLLGWFLVAVATLTKGPLGLVTPAASLTIFLFVYRKREEWRVSTLFPPLGIILFLLVVGSWVVLLFLSLDFEIILRKVLSQGNRHIGIHGDQLFSGPWYYVWAILRGMFPWALLLFVYRERREWNPEVVFLVAWVGTLLVVHSFFVSPLRIRYLVPALPAVALLAGHGLQVLQTPSRGRGRLGSIFIFGFGAASFAALVFGLVVLLPSGFVLKSGVLTAAAVAFSTLALLSLLKFAQTWKETDRAPLAYASSIALTMLLGTYFGFWMANGTVFPHYDLGRKYLGHTALGSSLAVVGLERTERSWLVVGAARELSNPSYPEDYRNAFEWVSEQRSDHLVATEAALEEMPEGLRQQYSVVARVKDDVVAVGPTMLLDYVRRGESPHRSGSAHPEIHLLARRQRPGTATPSFE